MSRDAINSTEGKVGAKARFPFDGGLRRWLEAALRAGTLALTISAGIQFLFPVATSQAQTPDCYREPFPPDEKPQYFPTGAFGVRGPSTAPWYSCHLRAMDERPLIPLAVVAGRGVYRLSVSPTWGATFVVRLDVRTEGTGVLVKKEARSEFEAGTLTVNVSQDVSKEDVEVFDSLLNKADFWSMPTILLWDRDPRVPLPSMGGVVWVLEGARLGTYHVVTRTLGRNPTGPYARLTSYLFRNFAHFEIPPIPPIPAKRKH